MGIGIGLGKLTPNDFVEHDAPLLSDSVMSPGNEIVGTLMQIRIVQVPLASEPCRFGVRIVLLYPPACRKSRPSHLQIPCGPKIAGAALSRRAIDGYI